MSVKLIRLPYAADALAPAISAETLNVHHGKHHKGYVDKVNKAVADTPLDSQPLEAVITAARQTDPGLFNNAAQVWNHGFYWHSLSPQSAVPGDALAAAIDRDFGSLDELLKQLAERGAAHFASGWIWLAAEKGTLSIEETHDAETLADQGKLPLLVIDVWEHAYYLDRANARDAYLKLAVAKLLNWEFASDLFDRETRWTYPG